MDRVYFAKSSCYGCYGSCYGNHLVMATLLWFSVFGKPHHLTLIVHTFHGIQQKFRKVMAAYLLLRFNIHVC